METFSVSNSLNYHTPHATVILLLGPEPTPTDVQTHVSQQQEIRVAISHLVTKAQREALQIPIKSGMVRVMADPHGEILYSKEKGQDQPYAPTWMHLINMRVSGCHETPKSACHVLPFI